MKASLAAFFLSVVIITALGLFVIVGTDGVDDLEPLRTSAQSDDSRPDTRVLVTLAGRTGQSIYQGTNLAWLADFLEARLPVRCRIRTAQSVDEFYERISGGQFDVLIMGPLAYVEARERVGVEPLAAILVSGERIYRGRILAADPSIRELADLKGRRVTYVDASTSGYLFPLSLCLAAGIDPHRDCLRFEPSGGHGDVIRNLIQGRYDAGFCADNLSLASFSTDSGKLRILARTDPIPTPVVVTSRAFRERSAELAADIRKLLVESAGEPEVVALAGRLVPKGTSFVAAEDKEYDSVRRVRKDLGKYLPEES